MDLILPLTLSGTNLQDRHRHFNSLVNETFKKKVSFQDIVCQPETSSIDRIFKIEFASKYRNVEYIIKNLKDDDMLYVSRALKCLWLLQPVYCSIINPFYLENNLYPEMIRPAVTKTKHWIQLNLKDTERCQEFYNYYKDNVDHAFIYFWHCSKEFIVNEFPNIMDKLSPKQLRIVFEVCPLACKLYFENLPSNNAALAKYVSNAPKYFNCIKSILKHDGNFFLDIVEKYFDNQSFNHFGPSTTQHIMKYYRNRFNAKSELYTFSFLDMKTVAVNLSCDQAKELIFLLAQAKYLDYWFSYKKVEPLIKRLKPEDRSSLKKQVFVEKSIGSKVKEWPYPIPKPLTLEVQEKAHVFTDINHKPFCFGYNGNENYYHCSRSRNRLIGSYKSPLDQLFDRYRFIGFEQTFYKLSKKLLGENSKEGRLTMMLVLVSKSGGVAEQVHKFLKLLVKRHINEPTTLRAAVIRSLVMRGCAWRLPDNVWSLLLEFGRDLGLDGAKIEPFCCEGLHAVVLRNLLADTTLSPRLLTAFRRKLSTLAEYKLNAVEIQLVGKRLPPLMLSLDLNFFLATLAQYKVDIKDIPDAEPALLKAAKGNSTLLYRLYKARILRRKLIRETFALGQNNAAYINALRHDTSLLENGKSFAKLVAKEPPNHDRFLKSLNTYFAEPGGLAERHRIYLEDAFALISHTWVARSFCFLISDKQLLEHCFKLESERPQSKAQLMMSTGLRANAHKTKPPVDIDGFDWRWIGAKAVANKVFICKSNDRQSYIKKLLEWHRTARISVRLSIGTTSSIDVFIRFSSLRPLASLKLALSLYLTNNHIEPRIWDTIKLIIKNTDVSQNQRLLRKLSDRSSIPQSVWGDYWVLVYNMLIQIDNKKAAPILSLLKRTLEDVDQGFTRGVVKWFIDDKLKPERFAQKDDNFYSFNMQCLYVGIIAKTLLLCKSPIQQTEVIEYVSEPFFDAIEVLIQTSEFKKPLLKLLNDFIYSLKYSKVFLSKHYVSCMPVFENILKRMRKIFPVEEYFAKYVEISLTMLYYKTLRRTIELKPDIFDNNKRLNEAIEIVGRIFGNYIGHEIKELVTKYFKSIVDLYKIILRKYLQSYFHLNNSRHLLTTFVIKGLLEEDTSEASILAEYIFQKEQKYISKPNHAEILKVLRETEDKELKLFVYANDISGAYIYKPLNIK